MNKSYVLGIVFTFFFAGVTQAEPITLNTGTETFTGLLLEGSGTPNVGVIFFHGRGGNPDGDVVGQLRQSLNADGYTTLSIANPVPSSGITTFSEYLANESIIQSQIFAYFNAAVDELVNRNNNIDTIVIGGFSLGSRFATATAAALNQGLFGMNPNVTLAGLLGVGMPSTIGGTDPSTSTNINIYDTINNLGLVSPSIPVLDLFGDGDTDAASNALNRLNAFQGMDYTQVVLGCPDFSGTTFYTLNEAGTSAIVYTENNCHQLRNAYPTANDALNDTNISVTLRGSADAPLESNVSDWFAAYVPLTPIPVPPSIWLFGSGLVWLVGASKRKKVA